MQAILKVLTALALLVMADVAAAQDVENLTISTVTRAPFSMEIDGIDEGFSIDLLGAVADELNLNITYSRKDSFSEMLEAVQAREVDGAIANISITAERERAPTSNCPFVSVVTPVTTSLVSLSETIMVANSIA